MEIKDVFISYKSEEFDEALWVKNSLEESGISCWMAPMSITGGASYASEIPQAIRGCKVFVLILTSKVMESKWVPKELDQAINADKLIMPFTLENCPLTSDFSFYLSNVQRYFAYEDKAAAMEKMTRDIKAKLGIHEPAPAPAPSPAPAPTPTPAPVPVHKPAPVQKPAKKSSGGLKVLGIIAACLAGVALIAALAFLNFKDSRITVAGQRFGKNITSITLENKTLGDEDMTALLELKKLYSVTFKNCRFDTESLAAVTAHELSYLELSDCGLTNKQVSTLNFEIQPDIYYLDLSGNPAITDLSVIAPLSDTLEQLRIGNVSLADTSVLEGFTLLNQIHLDDMELSDLSFLREMPYLTVVSACRNTINDISGLENTSILEEVYLSDNEISDLSVLSRSAETLRILDVSSNALTDLSCITECTALGRLTANDNELSSLAFAERLSGLYSLSLSGNDISDLGGFTGSESLTSLDLSRNGLKTVSGITFKADAYVTADFSENAILSATLPANCTFSRLRMHKNPLESVSFLDGIHGFKVSLNYFENIEADYLKNADFGTVYITDCPTGKRVELEDISYKIELVSAEAIPSLMEE